MICFSPINWDEVWEGPQEIMSQFAAAGWNVLFVENIGGRTPRLALHDLSRIGERVKRLVVAPRFEVSPPRGITVHTPFNLPPYRQQSIHNLNRRLLLSSLRSRLRDLGWERPVLWTYNPSRLVQECCAAIDPRLTIYCCVHDFRNLSPQHEQIARDEEQMLRKADLVFAVSRHLLERDRAAGSPVHVLPQGANLSHYLSRASGEKTELNDMTRPIIGYIGTVHKWVDQDLILSAARSRPDWTFVLIGPERVSTSRLRKQRNVVLLGHRAHARLPQYVSAFDVGIIPYLTSHGGSTLRPNKVLEYLVMGKPVVTTELPELKDFSHAILSIDTPEQFVPALELALATDSAEKQRQRRELAIANSLQTSFPALQARVLSKLAECGATVGSSSSH